MTKYTVQCLINNRLSVNTNFSSFSQDSSFWYFQLFNSLCSQMSNDFMVLILTDFMI